MPFALKKLPDHWMDLAHAAIILFGSLAVCLLIRHFTLLWLKRLDDRHGVTDGILFRSFRLPSLLWCVVGAMAITVEYGDLAARPLAWARAGSVVFFVVSICVVTASLVVRVMGSSAQKRGLTFGVSGVSRALIYVFVMLLGATVVFRYFSINITPLLTALGVGGLAVALALRDTLANFFAGVHILVEAPLSVGDFIKLASGEEGTVTDIGWRTTRMLTGNNNTVVVPNEKITSSILTNYALPDRRVVTEVVILTGLDADVARVMRIAVEEAQQVEGVLPEFTPLVIFDPGVTPTHLQMKLIVQVGHRLQVGLVQSNIRLRLIDRFRRDGISLPTLERYVIERPT